MRLDQILSWVSAILVLLLTAISLILTYSALYDIAIFAGYNTVILAKVWPLTIDGALIVFSLAVVDASLRNDDTKRRWIMVGAFVALTIIFNTIDGGVAQLPLSIQTILPFIVRAIPPISLVLSFETLMSILRKSVERNVANKSINELLADMAKLTNKRDKLIADIQAANGQLDAVEEATKQAKAKIKKQTTDQSILRFLPDNLPIEIRQQVVKKMVDTGMTIEAMATALGVSKGTIKGDKKAILMDN